MSSLVGKHITLAVTGGIAAYKCPELCRQLVQRGAQVQVVLTRSAKQFVTATVMKTLSGRNIPADSTDQWTDMDHIEIARWSDLVLIAPATADMIARLTAGRADDIITAVVLATQSTVACCPAMNKQMYKNSATQHNMEVLKGRKFQIWGPDEGEQACGDYGPGRMIEPEDIVDKCERLFQPKRLGGKTVVITAGPTREPLDPVRYLSNRSSGKMGYSLANAAASMGAKVIIISGPCICRLDNYDAISVVSVTTAEEMLSEVMKYVKDADMFIGCAAVCDYRPVEYKEEKIKSTKERMTVEFQKNCDIIAEVARLKEDRPFVIGFAAETSNTVENATAKLKNKNLNLICANDVSANSSGGFDSDYNEVVMLWDGHHKSVSGKKRDVARSILDQAIDLMDGVKSDPSKSHF